MVEGTGLENQRAGNGTVGSNPTLSAIVKDPESFSILDLLLCMQVEGFEPRLRSSGFGGVKLARRSLLRVRASGEGEAAIPPTS